MKKNLDAENVQHLVMKNLDGKMLQNYDLFSNEIILSKMKIKVKKIF